jgi:hypothetical protein
MRKNLANSLSYTYPLGESALNLPFLDMAIQGNRNGGLGLTKSVGDLGRFSGMPLWQPRNNIYKKKGISANFAVYHLIPTITENKEAMGTWVSFYRNWINREFFSNCKPC